MIVANMALLVLSIACKAMLNRKTYDYYDIVYWH